MAKPALEFIGDIEFVANIDADKDCLMNQTTKNQESQSDEIVKNEGNPLGLWFNIDIPKGHGLQAGDLIRITVEKVEK